MQTPSGRFAAEARSANCGTTQTMVRGDPGLADAITSPGAVPETKAIADGHAGTRRECPLVTAAL
jgi:hypothetical protein